MANFTGQPISSSYQRVLQIDGGIIQDGLGNTVDATINSLTGSFSGSFFGDGSNLTNVSSDNAQTASYVETAQTASYVQNAQTASFVTLAQTASYVQNAQTASYVLNAESSSYASSSSFSTSSSYSQNAGTLEGYNANVFATTGSNIFIGLQEISGALQLNPTEDPGTLFTNPSYLFVSSSADNSEYNLHYRNNGALWETHWLEERTDTGLTWGGVVTYSGSTIYVSPGAGILVNHNASTSSHGDTIPAYLQFGPITASATYITSSQLTYLLIDSDGTLLQQTSTFTPQQFNEKFPLGYITHLTTSSISAYADSRVTTYGQDEQQSQFIRSFGPLKVNGFDITPQSGSLKVSIASGRTYRYGGFYIQDPQNPSLYDTTTVATASFVRIYRDPSAIGGFKAQLNGALPFNVVDPTKWDDGSGTLQTVSSSQWTIQRAFQGAINGVTYIYYGQNTYDSLNAAVQSITTEEFQESSATQIALPFIGYIITKGDTTNLSDSTNNKIINSGLFRNTAGSSGGGGVATTILNDLSDVNITTPTTGEALIYNAGLWENGTPLNSTSASFASTASYVETAQTASFVTLAQTASFVTLAQTASYVANSTTSTTAQTASSITVINTNTGTTYYPVFVLGQVANNQPYIDKIAFSYNAVTDTLNVTSSIAISSSYAVTASYISTPYTAISSSTPQTINSTTFTTLTGTSITPSAGIWHVSAIVNGLNASNTSTFETALYYGGNIIPVTTAIINQVAGLRIPMTMQHMLIADGVTSFDVRARVTTAASANNASNYYLTLVKIA